MARRYWRKRQKQDSGNPVKGILALFVMGLLVYAITRIAQAILFLAMALTAFVIYVAVRSISKEGARLKQVSATEYHQRQVQPAWEPIRNEAIIVEQSPQQPQPYVSAPLVEKLPFTKRSYFFTNSERTFYTLLLSIAAKHSFCVFAKVRLEDLLKLPAMDVASKMHYRGKVRSRHVDFVLCDLRFFQPSLVIELDGWGHSSPRNKEIDEFKNRVLTDAGLPILRVKAAANYNPHDLESRILDKLTIRVERTQVMR